MSIYEIAKKYYPRLWGIERLMALLRGGETDRGGICRDHGG